VNLDDKETIQKRTVITQLIKSERIVDKDIMFISPKKRSYYGSAILITWRVEFLTMILLFNGVPKSILKMNVLRGEETAQFHGDSDDEL
jgi:hypothetical protein